MKERMTLSLMLKPMVEAITKKVKTKGSRITRVPIPKNMQNREMEPTLKTMEVR